MLHNLKKCKVKNGEFIQYRLEYNTPGHLQEAVNILGTNLAHIVPKEKKIYVTY